MTSAPSTTDWYEMLTWREPGVFGLGKQITFLTGLAALIAGLNLYAPAGPTFDERVLGSAAIALAALPTWLWLAGADRNLPFMPFFGMVFSVYYTVPIFILNDYRTSWSVAEMPSSLIARALEYILIGLLCVMAGYYGPQHILIDRVLPRMKMRWSRPGFLKLSSIGFGLLGMMIFLYGHSSVSTSLQMFVAFGSDLCMIGITLLFAMQIFGILDRISKLFLWLVLVPSRIWIGLATGLTSEGLIVMLLLIFIYSAAWHRMPWSLILAGGLMFIILRPIETGFRLITRQGGLSENVSALDKSKILFQMIGDSIVPMIEGRGTAYDTSIEISSRRLGTDILTFAAVLGDTPNNVPYWNGASYYPLIFKFVPRFLYPDKPEEVTGQTFGHRYGLLDPMNFTTSYNLPQLIEAYINFGVAGVVAVMFLFGIVYRAVQTIFVHPGMGFGSLIFGIYVSIGLLQIESAASLVLGSAIWSFVYASLLNLLVQSGTLEHLLMVSMEEPLVG